MSGQANVYTSDQKTKLQHTEVYAGVPIKYYIDHAIDYYPYGKTLREYFTPSKERYLKTHQKMNYCCWQAKPMCPLTHSHSHPLWIADVMRFLSVDPLAADYVAWSGFNYVLGNPLIFVDPDGRAPDDWFMDEDGMVMYDKNVKSQSDLKAGQKYLGESYIGKGASGKSVYYNEGGSIFFKSEKDALNYMWFNSEKTKVENFGFIFGDGIAILPNYANTLSSSGLKVYGFDINSSMQLTSEGYTHKSPVIGSIHTHNAALGEEGPSGADIHFATTKTPNRPAFMMGDDNVMYGVSGNINKSMESRSNPRGYDYNTISMPPVSNFLNGKSQLIPYLKNYKR